MADLAGGRQTPGNSDRSKSPSASRADSRAAPTERSFSLPRLRQESPVDDCGACGFSAEHLIQLVNMARRCIPNDDAVFDALASNGLSDTVKSAIRLQVCLESIRDYVSDVERAQRQAHRAVRPVALREHKTERLDSAAPEGSNSSSSDGSDSQDSDVPRGTRSSDDSDVAESTESAGSALRAVRKQRAKQLTESESRNGINTYGGSGKTVVRGQLRKWTSLEESRLRAYKKEDKSDLWIAAILKRSENAVFQHWNIMCKRDSLR